MDAVRFSQLNKSFGTVNVLKDISMEIAEGEFMVLVGPSGCGKSTLLRCLAGLEKIESGSIQIAGRNVTTLDPKDRDIAMVFQSYALYPHRTVEGNMRFSLRLARRPEAEIRKKVAEAADILGLTDFMDRYPKQLSGGQRQRVAMGRAIVRDPSVFLFDEPLSNLDASLRVQMRGEIRSLQQRLGTTTVYVTHDQIEAMTMADRICVLRSGRIEQIGTPLELYDWPANRFVAGFIGSPAMNFLPAQANDGALLLEGTDASIACPAGISLVKEQQILLGLRPDNVIPVETGGIPLRVSLVEPTGSETLLSGTVGETHATFVVRERISAEVGQVVRLSASGTAVHLFEPDSGICLTTANYRNQP